MNWYLAALKKYAVFSGRARRKELWYFVLFNMIIAIVLGFADIILGFWESEESGGPALMGLYFLATFIPVIAVSIRRLHDTGRSGWWFLITLIPFIGGFGLLWLLTQRGTPRANAYGPDPIG